jgi:integrase|tara:strand:- start:57 stop:251 length:195 start_codon:yes stop_codon:yes gene_type:complete
VSNEPHACNLIDAEIYPLAISRRLGHSTIAITMDIYSHFFNRKKKKMVSMLESIQGGQKGESSG